MRNLTRALCALAMAAAPAKAAVFTVGPGEDIQSAVDMALASAGSHEVRITSGRFVGQLEILPYAGVSLELSGGWAPDFRTSGFGETVIDGGDRAPVIQIAGSGGNLIVRNVVVTGGVSSDSAGGLLMHLFGDLRVEVTGSAIRANHVSGALSVGGAGLLAWLRDDSKLLLRQNAFKGNTGVASDPGSSASGVGAGIHGFHRSHVDITGNGFFENLASARDTYGSALAVALSDEATADVADNQFQWNEVEPSSGQATIVSLSAGQEQTSTARLTARRNTLTDNTLATTAEHAYQMAVGTNGDGTLVLSDGVIARGSHRGLYAGSLGGLVYVTNMTITGHPELGVGGGSASPSGGVFLSNSIVFDNGSDVAATLTPTSSLIGSDPRFVDASRGNYRLEPGSPGIDAGADSPPGGLGPLDLDSGLRVQGPHVDMGAYETAGPGSGSGTTTETSCRALWADPPVSRYTNACRCVSDPTLSAMRCALMGPEMFMVLRISLRPRFPGGPVPADWTIHPWLPLNGPYTMQMEVLIDGKWQPQVWYGPTARSLGEGKLVVEPFQTELSPEGPTALRTRILYRRGNQKAPAVGILEVLVPEAK